MRPQMFHFRIYKLSERDNLHFFTLHIAFVTIAFCQFVFNNDRSIYLCSSIAVFKRHAKTILTDIVRLLHVLFAC